MKACEFSWPGFCDAAFVFGVCRTRHLKRLCWRSSNAMTNQVGSVDVDKARSYIGLPVNEHDIFLSVGHSRPLFGFSSLFLGTLLTMIGSNAGNTEQNRDRVTKERRFLSGVKLKTFQYKVKSRKDSFLSNSGPSSKFKK